MNYVYCIRVGSEDCFKIGFSKTPDIRLSNLSTGSSQRLKPERLIPLADAKQVEVHLHAVFAARRRDVGEFFDISLDEFDAALEQAQTDLAKSEPLLQAAKALRKRRPGDRMPQPSADDVQTCRQLKVARAEAYFIERRIALLESKLQLSIGENAGLEGIASWKWVEQQRFRLDLFREQHPRLCSRYTEVRSGRVFKLANARIAATGAGAGQIPKMPKRRA